jgi:HAD superfamily hydrolase (TIGR01509 family)
MEYEDLVRTVFDSDTARRASVGAMTEEQHWIALALKFGRQPSEMDALRAEFFAGDIVDNELVTFIRSLRPRYRTGLISNAWDGLRPYIVSQKFDDAFDLMIISSEAKLMKPDIGIFQLALDQSGVAADEAVFIDDMDANVEAARSMGMAGFVFHEREATLDRIKSLLNL